MAPVVLLMANPAGETLNDPPGLKPAAGMRFGAVALLHKLVAV